MFFFIALGSAEFVQLMDHIPFLVPCHIFPAVQLSSLSLILTKRKPQTQPPKAIVYAAGLTHDL